MTTTEEDKRKALISLIRNAAFEASHPDPVRNPFGEPISNAFAGPEFNVRNPSTYWQNALVQALAETDALFVLERMTEGMTDEI